MSFHCRCAVLLITASSALSAQTHSTHAQAGADNVPPGTDPALRLQIEQLRRQVQDLEAQMGAKAPPKKGASRSYPASGMSTMPRIGPPTSPAVAGMTPMSAATALLSAPMPAWDCADCLAEMGVVVWMSSAAGASGAPPLPGFPGASHIYHVGAGDFFLDQAERAGLSLDQQARLGRMRERALLDRASSARKLDEADQQLFALTSADRPDAERIEAQVRRIEALRTTRRLDFIRAVGEAAQVLNDQQRQAIIGATRSGS